MEELIASGGILTLLFFLSLNVALVGAGIIVAKRLDEKNENR